MRRILLVVLLLLLPALFFFRHSLSLSHYVSARQASAAVKANAAVTYETLLADLDKRIQSFAERAAKRPADWIVRQWLAKALLERGALRGGLVDFAEAGKVLDEAFKIAPPGSGPLLVAARLNYSVHRLNQSEKYLEMIGGQAAVKADTQIAVISMRANLAFHRGEYAEALAGYRTCELAKPGACLTELATYYGNTGGYSEAEALLQHAYAQAAPEDRQSQAWLKLQLGILSMKQGRYDQALNSLQFADQLLPGWWLIREHIAETHELRGELPEAVRIYEQVVRETGFPQYMDALAEGYEKQGKHREAGELQKQARRLWEEQLSQFPEAAGGHALEHFLKGDTDGKRLLELAEGNFRTRPGGEARQFLAEAYLKAGREKEALGHVEILLAGPFLNAELYALASRVYRAAGNEPLAEKYARRCLEINPRYSL